MSASLPNKQFNLILEVDLDLGVSESFQLLCAPVAILQVITGRRRSASPDARIVVYA